MYVRAGGIIRSADIEVQPAVLIDNVKAAVGITGRNKFKSWAAESFSAYCWILVPFDVPEP